MTSFLTRSILSTSLSSRITNSSCQHALFLKKNSSQRPSFSSKVVADFRSDTVTQPTPGMWDAMRASPLGDDVFGDDPTVHKIERFVAELTKKPAALFCVTATMANQLGLKCVLQSGTSVLCSSDAHINTSETGGVAHHSSAHIIPVSPVPVEWREAWGSPLELEPTGGRAELTVECLAPQLKGPNVHYPMTTAIALENTVGGVIQSLDNLKKIHTYAKNNPFRKLHMHLDGARLWNATVETGIPMSEYCKYVDTVSLCLSKGLGAPVGALLVGEHELIQRARHFRKMFGGGWRQAGLLAGAGLYAMEHHWPQMKEDHRRARHLAKELQKLGFYIEKKVDTNMVWASTRGPQQQQQQQSSSKYESRVSTISLSELSSFVRTHGIIFDIWSSDEQTRLVLHHEITDVHIQQFLDLIKLFLQQKHL